MKRTITLVTISIFCMVFLAACGGGGGSNSSTQDTVQNTVQKGSLQIILNAGNTTATAAHAKNPTAKVSDEAILTVLPKYIKKLNVTLFTPGNVFFGTYSSNVTNGVSAPINNLPVNNYTLGIDCENQTGNVLYSGSGSAAVVSGTTSSASINVLVKDTITVPIVITGITGNFNQEPATYTVSVTAISSTNNTDNVSSSDTAGYMDTAGAFHFNATLRLYYTTQSDTLHFSVTDKNGALITHEGPIDIYTILDDLNTGTQISLPYTAYIAPGGLSITVNFPTS